MENGQFKKGFSFGKVELGVSAQFHILRHFQSVPSDYQERLFNAGIKPEEISRQLSLSGGKFYHAFAANPEALWLKLRTRLEATCPDIKWDRDFARCSIQFNTLDYEQGIGFDGIIRIDALPVAEIPFIKLEERDGYLVKVYGQAVRHPTWQANLVLQKNEFGIFVKTIFPGTLAPPFPVKSMMTEPELENSLAFWNNSALIK